MRGFLCLILILFVAGCSSTGQKDLQIDKKFKYDANKIPRTLPEKEVDKKVEKREVRKVNYTGIRGYFNRPPLFADTFGEKLFDRCESFSIVSVNNYSGRVLVTVQQGNKQIQIAGLNCKEFTMNQKGSISLLNRYFVKNLDVLEKRNKRDIASAKHYLCNGKNWKAMTKEEFLFVNGRPEKKVQSKIEGRVVETWTYKSPYRESAANYYFQNDLLYAWQ